MLFDIKTAVINIITKHLFANWSNHLIISFKTLYTMHNEEKQAQNT